MRLLAVLALLCAFPALAGTPSIDPSGAVTATSTTDSVSLALSTTNSSDVVIIASTFAVTNDSPLAVIQSISGGALTWARHGSACSEATSTATRIQEVWYAIAASPLSSASITVHYYSGYGTYSERVVAFGVSGANTSTPFDTNSSIPGCVTGTTVASLSYSASTANADDLILATAGFSAATVSCPSGFATIGTGSTTSCYSYEIVSSTLSGTSLTSSTTGSPAASAMFIDAIQGAGGASCTHSSITATGAISVPNGSTGSYRLANGSIGTPDCSTKLYPNSAGGIAVN